MEEEDLVESQIDIKIDKEEIKHQEDSKTFDNYIEEEKDRVDVVHDVVHDDEHVEGEYYNTRLSEDDLTSSQHDLLDGVLESGGRDPRFSTHFLSLTCFRKEVHIPILGVIAFLFVFLVVISVSSVGIVLGLKSHQHTTDNDTPLYTNLNTTVIMISIDGFRSKYFSQYANVATNLTSMAEEGVKAMSMQPVFPSKTFPNHYSIATGLYPESHGIVANHMYDPVFNSTFTLGSKDPRWWGGEPIWITAEKQGHKVGTIFWPGSDVNISGVYPTYYEMYNGSMPYKERVNKVLSLLDLKDEERPTLLTLYFEEVDHAGHAYGPESSNIPTAMRTVDEALGLLISGLKERGIYENVNIIITSDHGMTGIDKQHVIMISGAQGLHDAMVVTSSPILMAIPKQGEEQLLFDALKNIHPNLTVYKKEDIPDRFHFQKNRRITPIVGIADVGWSISTSGYLSFVGGTHGYDNTDPDMQAIFIARGPVFKKGFISSPFENLHVYELVSHILGLTPAPNNGSLAAINHILYTNEK